MARHLDGIHYRPASPTQPVTRLPESPLATRSPRSRRKFPVWLVGLTVLFLYFAAAPFLPNAWYVLRPPHNNTQSAADVGATNPPADRSPAVLGAASRIPAENTLVIPKIGVDALIFEGTSETTLERGLWRRPKTGTPSTGGNTVITAHRFKYLTGPNTFYHLDKLAVGDSLTIYWEGKTYHYRVTSSEVVAADAFIIEENSPEPRLTLYTCTPLWTSSKRLVVRAEPASL
jgi:LPXTG-site transpeptidase (sortase) family protein